jgi:hypothetical protein
VIKPTGKNPWGIGREFDPLQYSSLRLGVIFFLRP